MGNHNLLYQHFPIEQCKRLRFVEEVEENCMKQRHIFIWTNDISNINLMYILLCTLLCESQVVIEWTPNTSKVSKFSRNLTSIIGLHFLKRPNFFHSKALNAMPPARKKYTTSCRYKILVGASNDIAMES